MNDANASNPPRFNAQQLIGVFTVAVIFALDMFPALLNGVALKNWGHSIVTIGAISYFLMVAWKGRFSLTD